MGDATLLPLGDRGDNNGGVSVGVAVGAGIGAAVGSILICVVAWLLFRRHRLLNDTDKRRQQQQQQYQNNQRELLANYSAPSGRFQPPGEFPGEGMVELPGQGVRF